MLDAVFSYIAKIRRKVILSLPVWFRAGCCACIILALVVFAVQGTLSGLFIPALCFLYIFWTGPVLVLIDIPKDKIYLLHLANHYLALCFAAGSLIYLILLMLSIILGGWQDYGYGGFALMAFAFFARREIWKARILK